ncbi:MAG: hypothetical protein V2J25_15920 [Desulfatiglans sp.]|nr:hypothetical protein [Thermodesulfobacteriota bacterium]MEE4354349.1 hypothetical protein [Desulfatiglans sp.]
MSHSKACRKHGLSSKTPKIDRGIHRKFPGGMEVEEGLHEGSAGWLREDLTIQEVDSPW